MLFAQTSGNIYTQPAVTFYKTMLDPNGDGYITKSGGAFTSDTTEIEEFELLSNSTTGWIKIVDVDEAGSDVSPSCGSTDIVTDANGGDFAYYNIVDPTPSDPRSGDEYMIFRFRLGKAPSGSFGYHFLIDSDLEYGAHSDSNSICGNPGFEKEVQLGGKGVSVFDMDGITKIVKGTKHPCSTCLNIKDVEQESYAFAAKGCTNTPVFVTFPVALSYLDISSNVMTSDLFIVMGTSSSGNQTSVLGGGNVTDLGSLNGTSPKCDCSGITDACAIFDCELACIETAFIEENSRLVLPVDLVSFSAEQKENVVQLSWETASELNNDYFVVEHSIDGDNFEVVEYVDGAGNSQSSITYDYTHEEPANGVNYYRLKQVDFDGTFTYSTIQSIHIENYNRKVSVRPNIVRNKVYLYFEGLGEGERHGEIVNIMGEKMIDFIIDQDEETLRIMVEHYPKGHYLVRVKFEDTTIVQRFVKH